VRDITFNGGIENCSFLKVLRQCPLVLVEVSLREGKALGNENIKC
jgi:hypothetical protein